MYKRRCSWCRKVMEFKLGEPIKSFCSKECYSMDREKRFASEDDGPPMKPLTAESLTDDGFLALVEAIVARAGEDVSHFAPGTQIRVSAEKFFESDFFSALTGLDGQAVLRDLREAAKKKKPETRGKKPRNRACQCIETGVVYDSIKEAAKVYNCEPSGIHDVCAKNGRRQRAGGMHWRYVEKGVVG